MERLTLRAGALELQLLPATGGSLARFDYLGPDGRQPLLRGTDTNYTDVLEAACFPLVPFANRIRDGRFTCDGVDVELAPNMAGDPSPLHGQGWRSAWTVAQADETTAELVFKHAAGEWPWDYEARQRIVLLQDYLSIRLSCRNMSPRPMPCGLGLHPYYPCTERTVLDTSVESVWTVDAKTLPVANVPATGRYDLRRRAICGQDLDNGYEVWDGTARIAWPERGLALTLSSPDASRFQVYSPPSGGLFVAEPVQNANAALNEPQERWPQLGLAMLEPGEEAVLSVQFRPECYLGP